ncbi:MAG: zinc ribbon domain-containing protein [Legionellales bacterium]|nr:zinc ribbon domain-containing protein [Legionellales bacterium]
MPFYEYQCQACGHHFEVLQKISDTPLSQCPQCGKPQLSKLVSAPSFQLKGSGWYETDFKNKPQPEAKPAESTTSTEAKKTDSPAETKAE